MTGISSGPLARRTRWTAALVLATTFVAGGLSGAGLQAFAARRDGPPLPGIPLPMPSSFAALHLTPEQQVRVQAIFARNQPRVGEILRESLPRMHALMRDIDVQVRDVLTPEQRATLDELRSKRRPMGPPGFDGLGPPPFPDRR